jgi:hypothetical protein
LWHKVLRRNNALYEINAINEFYAINALQSRAVVLVVGRCKIDLDIAMSEGRAAKVGALEWPMAKLQSAYVVLPLRFDATRRRDDTAKETDRNVQKLR